MKIYVSGALAAAADLSASIAFYEWLSHALSQDGYHVHLPHKTNHPSLHHGRGDVSVFNDDLQSLTGCDVCIARLDEPSLGVGAEIALALQHKLPVLAYHRTELHVSRFVTGLLRHAGEPNTVITYRDQADLLQQIRGRLGEILAPHYRT